jgi:hypothetical protein
MDGYGLALEHYDPTGAWRESDGAFEIDDAVEVDNGRRVRGAGELERALADDPRFARALAAKLAVYALGRGLAEDDEAALDELVRSLGGNAATLADLIAGIVQLDSFRRRSVGGRP